MRTIRSLEASSPGPSPALIHETQPTAPPSLKAGHQGGHSSWKKRLRQPALMTGLISRALSQWVLMWAFARLAGPAGAGEFASLLAVTGPIFILAQFGIRDLYITAHRRISFGPYLMLRMTTSLAATGIALLLIMIILPDIGRGLIWAILVIRILELLIDIEMASLQARNAMYTIAAAMISRGLGIIAVVLVSVLLGAAAAQMAWAAAAASLAVCIALAPPTLRVELRKGMRGARGDYRYIVRKAWPLGFAQSIISFSTYLPVLFLTVFGTSETVGRFAVIYYFITAMNLVYNSVAQVAVTDYADAFRRTGPSGLGTMFRRSLMVMCSVGLVGAVGVVIAGPSVISVLYGDAFDVTALEMLPIGATILLLASITCVTPLLMVLNKYRAELGIAVVALTSAVAICACLLSSPTIVAAGSILAGLTTARLIISLVVVGKVRELRQQQPLPAGEP
jgi:O-antigen/teichoic acid export membrane protein